MYVLICEEEGLGITEVILRDTRDELVSEMCRKYEAALDDAEDNPYLDHDCCPTAGSAYVIGHVELSIHECNYGG